MKHSFDEIPVSKIKETVAEYIHNEKHRMIILRRLCDGVCFEPLAEEFDMSVTQVKRIVYKTEDKIFRHI